MPAAEIQHLFAYKVGLTPQTAPEAGILPRAALEIGDITRL
jgi:hypothetical protein